MISHVRQTSILSSAFCADVSALSGPVTRRFSLNHVLFSCLFHVIRHAQVTRLHRFTAFFWPGPENNWPLLVKPISCACFHAVVFRLVLFYESFHIYDIAVGQRTRMYYHRLCISVWRQVKTENQQHLVSCAHALRPGHVTAALGFPGWLQLEILIPRTCVPGTAPYDLHTNPHHSHMLSQMSLCFDWPKFFGSTMFMASLRIHIIRA